MSAHGAAAQEAWLVLIIVNPGSREARTDLYNVVSLHRRLMMLAPDGITGERAREQVGMLFRVEHTRSGPRVLVQCQIKPLVGRLPAGYGKAAVRPLTPLLGRLQKGVPVHYRIAASPTKCVRSPKAPAGENDVDFFAGGIEPPRGKVTSVAGDDAARWWENRATVGGLTLSSAAMTRVRSARGDDGGKAIVHKLLQFDGSAVVADPDALRRAVLGGIGRGKPYGAGLLSLALQATPGNP